MSDKKKIVVIDDEEDLCLLVKDSLEDTGEFDVVSTSDPLTAEDFCRKEKPDLILLDNVMPKKKGSEIVKALKGDDQTNSIPIIMASGKGEMVYSRKKDQFKWMPNNPIAQDRGEIVDGKDSHMLSDAYGVDDYISKPFTTELLVEVIKEVLTKKEKEKRAKEEDQ